MQTAAMTSQTLLMFSPRLNATVPTANAPARPNGAHIAALRIRIMAPDSPQLPLKY